MKLARILWGGPLGMLVNIMLMVAIAIGFSGGCKAGFEMCINHPKYGKVCAVRVDGKWFLKADLAPDAAKEVLDLIRREDPDSHD